MNGNKSNTVDAVGLSAYPAAVALLLAKLAHLFRLLLLRLRLSLWLATCTLAAGRITIVLARMFVMMTPTDLLTPCVSSWRD